MVRKKFERKRKAKREAAPQVREKQPYTRDTSKWPEIVAYKKGFLRVNVLSDEITYVTYPRLKRIEVRKPGSQGYQEWVRRFEKHVGRTIVEQSPGAEAKREIERLKREASSAEGLVTKLKNELKAKTDWADHEIEFYKHHKNTIVEQLKTWSFTLNRLGIGLEIAMEWVRFTKGTMCIALHIDHVMDHGMHTIIDMMNRVPGNPAAFNKIEGEYGWKHPDAIKADKEVAVEKCGKLLRNAGFKAGDNLTVPVAAEED